MKSISFIAILTLAFLLRLLVANQPFQEDEFHWAGGIAVKDWFGMASRNSPLSFAVFHVNAAVFGESSMTLLRLPFILAGIATIAAVYYFARRNYSERTALIAAAVLAISPHHILASTQATYEGSFFTLFFFLTLASVLNKKYLLASMFFGLALLSKTSAIILLPPLIFLLVFYQADFKKALKTTISATLVSASMFFMGFVIPSIIAQSPAFMNAIAQLLSQTGLRRENLLLLFIQYAYSLIWVGPMLIFLPLFSAVRKNSSIWIIMGFILFFYTVIVRDNFPPMERYVMVILPFLAILAAQAIDKVYTKKRARTYSILIGVTTIVLGVLLNLGTSQHIPFNNKAALVRQGLSDLNFLLPISGSSGPLGFYVPFVFVAVVFMTTALIALFSLAAKKKQWFGIVFIVSVSMGFNVLFFTEYATGLFHGSIPEASMELVKYANKEVLPLPVYFLRNYALQYHLSPQYKTHPFVTEKQAFNYVSLEAYKEYNATKHILNATRLALDRNIRTLSFAVDTYASVTALKEQVKKEGGTFLIVDFPHIDKDGQLFTFLTTCNLQAQPHEFAYVFRCSSSSS